MEIMTNFLAEECLGFLKEKVEPEFPGIRFETYKPGPDTPVKRYAARVLIIIDDKTVFKYKLKGISTTNWHVISSLKTYAYNIHKISLSDY